MCILRRPQSILEGEKIMHNNIEMQLLILQNEPNDNEDANNPNGVNIQIQGNAQTQADIEMETPIPIPFIQPAIDKVISWPYCGLMFATISSFFFSLCSVIVKWMVRVDPFQLALFRFVGVLLPIIPLLAWSNRDPFPIQHRNMLLLRAFFGSMALIFSFYAFRHMFLADASIIIFSVPVFVTIFARVFLKEPCSSLNVVAIVLTLLGVVLITRPTFTFGESSSIFQAEGKDGNNIFGIGSAFAATLFGAGAYVFLRALKTVHYSVVMFNFSAFAIFQASFATYFHGTLCFPSCGYERGLVIMLGIFSFAGQVLLTVASQLENAGPISIARSSDIVFAFIWQYLFFGEIPDTYSVTGGILVTGSVLLLGFRKWLLSLPYDHIYRRKLYLLTL